MATATAKRSRRGTTGVRARAKRFVDLWVQLFSDDDLLTAASAIGFRMLIALVPLTLLGLALLGVTGNQHVWNDTIGPAIRGRVIPQVYLGVNASVQRIFDSSGGGLIAFASVLALWDVSGAVRASMSGMNKIYDTKETRSTRRRIGVSAALAVGIGLLILGTLGLLISLPAAVSSGWLHWLVAVLRWPLAVVLLAAAIGLLLRFGPTKPRPAEWATAGSLAVIAAWIVASLLFRVYVDHVANFKSAPGTLTAFLVLTAYTYTTAIIFLVGVELDEQVREHVPEEERALHKLVRRLRP
jgi:membrane protein